eukprot:804169_1
MAILASSCLVVLIVVLTTLSLWYALQYLKTDADWSTFHAKLNKEYYRGRIIWITGASSGIGKALAYKYASLNMDCKLVLSSRRENVLNKIRTDLVQNKSFNIKENHILVLAMDCNERDIQYYKDKYNVILDHFKCKSIDILINNAGYSMRSYCIDFADKDHVDMYQANLITPTLLAKLVVQDAVKDKDNQFAHIVNVASVIARFHIPTRTIYSATKTGLLGFSYSLRDELTQYKDINVSVVLPGPVATNIDVTAKGKQGKGHNQQDSSIQSGMSTARCAELISNAVSHKIMETWPCVRPVLDGMYTIYYFPALYNRFVRSIVAKKLMKDAGYKSE